MIRLHRSSDRLSDLDTRSPERWSCVDGHGWRQSDDHSGL